MYDRYTFRFISFCILLVILIFTEQYLWKLVFIFFLKENSKSLFFSSMKFFSLLRLLYSKKTNADKCEESKVFTISQRKMLYNRYV